VADLIRVSKEMADALLTVQKYIKYATGRKATETEIANTLKSYFIFNEIGNQIKFQRKKTDLTENTHQEKQKDPFWTMNLIRVSSRNNLARAGLFSACIQEGIQTTADFVKKITGESATDAEIVNSLKSSFILSEIKNQIDWQRKNSEKATPSRPND